MRTILIAIAAFTLSAPHAFSQIAKDPFGSAVENVKGVFYVTYDEAYAYKIKRGKPVPYPEENDRDFGDTIRNPKSRLEDGMTRYAYKKLKVGQKLNLTSTKSEFIYRVNSKSGTKWYVDSCDVTPESEYLKEQELEKSAEEKARDAAANTSPCPKKGAAIFNRKSVAFKYLQYAEDYEAIGDNIELKKAYAENKRLEYGEITDYVYYMDAGETVAVLEWATPTIVKIVYSNGDVLYTESNNLSNNK